MRKSIALVLVLSSVLSFGQTASITDLWKVYNSRDFKSVIEKVVPLLEKDSANLNLNLMAGRSYADLADYQRAVPYLELTVKNDFNNSWLKAWALSYLGTCYFMLEKYGESEKSIRDCIQLNATQNATNEAYGQSFIFGTNDFYKSWKIVDSEHFRFHFQNMKQEEITNYVALREKAYTGINAFFNSRLPKRIDFFVWESREDAKRIFKADLGFAKPEFCIVHSHFQQTIGHEMTHVISNYTASLEGKTRFINEGTAVCFDLTRQDRLKIVKDWLTANNKKVAVMDYWQNGKDYSEEILYPLAGLFVKELLDQFGKEKFLEFFTNQSYDHARAVFGERLDKVIQDFESKVNG